MKVTAIKRGFIHGEYKRPGDKFECTTTEFSKVWMTEGEVKEEVADKVVIKKGADVSKLEMPKLEIPSLIKKEDEKKATQKKETKPKKTKATKKVS
jgi:hypothetical protein